MGFAVVFIAWLQKSSEDEDEWVLHRRRTTIGRRILLAYGGCALPCDVLSCPERSLTSRRVPAGRDGVSLNAGRTTYKQHAAHGAPHRR